MVRVEEIEGGVRITRTHLTFEHEEVSVCWEFKPDEFSKLCAQITQLVHGRVVRARAVKMPDACVEGGI